MNIRRWAFTLALVTSLLGAGSALHAQTAVTADTPGKTASGVAFVQPKDWTETGKAAVTTFTSPEGDLSIAVVDVGPAASSQAAADKAWSLYKPDAKRAVRLASPVPPGDGWDERVSLAYETSPAEKAEVAALTLRKGPAWTVMILDGADATLNKRAAAVGLIQSSLRPAGYAAETFAGRTAHRLTPERIQALRGFIAQSAKELEVPGVGIALIDQGKVVWEGGYGVRELGHDEPVDAHTKFMIASNTKGMTTLMLSVLADEGKLRWGEKVVDLYPAFRLGDDAVTRAVEVRHLICACTGLPRRDYAFILADPNLPASDTFRQLSQTMPTSRFGELFQYSNLMAAAAGYVGGHLAYPGLELGAAYDKAMQTRVFGPLGMKSTTFDYKKAQTGNYALPQATDLDGKPTAGPHAMNSSAIPVRPAGAAWSTVTDMLAYIKMELAEGKLPDGKQYISKEALLARRAPQVTIGKDSAYGMGLGITTGDGVTIIGHTGGIFGFHSNMMWLPEHGVGAVILTNSDRGAVIHAAFERKLLEVLFDGKPEADARVVANQKRFVEAVGLVRQQIVVPADATAAGKLAAHYTSAEAGEIKVSRKGAATWFDFGEFKSEMASKKNPDGSVSFVTIMPGLIGLELVVGGSGKRTLTLRESQHEYVFTET